jgi:isoleucyl-tRNA synthetase
MSYFKTLPQNPDFPEMERELVESWYKNDIVNQYLHKNDKSEKIYSQIDGPITANGPMGVHHARGRTLKDLFQRYKNAQGFAQRFQNGFDCQGLWVEVEIEKECGFNSKKDIQNFGLDNFTNACISRVKKFAALQTEQSKRLGQFMDWENSYYTMSETNNLYIWHFLKVVKEKGWLYKKKSATTWCPRCETGLSQHEEADGYKDITDTSVYLKFKLKDRTNEYVLAWTTTPWTLSANVLLAINTEFEYVKVKDENNYIYLAKDSADRLGFKDYEKIDPKSLLNLEYESLYNIPAQKNVKHYITQWEMVNPSEGTGVVHIAPGCGQEDFDLGKKLKSDMISPIDETGHFIEGFGELTGLYAHDVAPLVFDYLKGIESLFKTEPITHRYPHCWRCKTKCLFRLEDNWFIDCDEIRPLLKKAASEAHWIPKYALRRMQNWLDNMEDWMISRKRFYGLALPFYECSCGEFIVVGSKDELKTLAVNPEKVDTLPTLHRPWIDEILIKCPKCGQEIKRIADVGDCWLDAGVVPFSTLKYLEDKNYWKKWFPADLVLEMIEQVRLWYYSMLFFGVVLEQKIPFKNVVSHAEVRDEKGERMSKTKKNGIAFDEAVEKMSADAMRWLYCQQKSHVAVNFGYTITDQVKRDFILILWNSYRFFVEHANLDDWQPQKQELNTDNILDQWILSRLNTTVQKVTKHLDNFTTPQSTQLIQKFVSDLSTWYIRRSRDRHDNYQVLFHCFETLAKVLSPFTPFLAETIFQNMNPNQSVHLQDWPKADETKINSNLEKSMEKVREICQLIHGQRQKASLKVRQPLAKATVKINLSKIDDKLIEIIKDETNVKEIDWIKTDSNIIETELDTNLTPQLIEEGEYRDFVRNIQVMRKDQQMEVKDQIKIFAPNWPISFEKEILAKTLAISIEKSDILKIEKNNY